MPTIEPRFSETYFYADVITAAVEDRFDHLNLWDEYLCDGAITGLLTPFAPRSAFHTFVGFVIDHVLYDKTVGVDLDDRKAIGRACQNIPEAIADMDPFTLPVEAALRRRRFDFESFVEWLHENEQSFMTAEPDDVYEYFQDLRLCGPYEELVDLSTREVFFTLFVNRTLLLQFNAIVAQHVADLASVEQDDDLLTDVARLFERPGVLRRAYMPEWVRRAVFYRDRGRCVGCNIDLSGTVSLWSEGNYDHMVPLASGGLNDVTNIQLLCAACNRRKADGAAFTSGSYEDWYSMSEPSFPTSARGNETADTHAKAAGSGARRRKR